MKKGPDMKVTPPGPEAKKILDRDAKYMATSTKTSPIVAKRGHGIYIEDVDGNTYLDFTSGIGVANVGYCHPYLVKVLKEQIDNLWHFAGTDFYYEIQVKLAEELCRITPGDFEKKVFLANSGAEANEAAIKVSRWSTGRKQFVSFIGAFHGRTMGALALTGSKTVHKNRFFPLMPGVTHLPYGYCYRCAYKQEYPKCDLWCAKVLDELYFETFLPPDEVAAIFVEPVQGEGGYIVPPRQFIPELKRIADKHGILLVVDEVQTGFGRTGKMFAVEHSGVVPDIMPMAKGLGAGLPIGGIVFNAKYDFGIQGAHSNTYGGNLVASTAALANIETIKKERLVENSARVGKYLRKGLDELKEKFEFIGDVRGLGLMQATEFVEDRKTKKRAKARRDQIVKLAYENGLILLPCGPSGIRYIPPLIIKEDEVDVALAVLEKVMRQGQ